MIERQPYILMVIIDYADSKSFFFFKIQVFRELLNTFKFTGFTDRSRQAL